MRGQRHRIAHGVYRDNIGFEVRVKHRRQHKSQRFPAGTPLATMQAWQRRQMALIDLGQQTDGRATTLAQDAAKYLGLLSGRTKSDTEDLLNHWLRLYGTQPRAALTAPLIHGQLLEWLRDGVAAQTCNHRRRALVTLWRVLDGREAPNPAKACPKLPQPRPEPRGLPWTTITAILAAMRPSATKTRLMVIAHTGLPHAVVARLEPRDLFLTAQPPYILVRPRRKGAGVPAMALAVTPDAAAALRDFARRKLFGAFSTSSMRTSFRLAVKKVGGPPDARPYDLRHSHAVQLYAATGDLRAVAGAMLHADIRTTSHYAAQAVAGNVQTAINALAQARMSGTRGGTARPHAQSGPK